MNEQQLPTSEPSIENPPQVGPTEAAETAASLHADCRERPAGVPEKFWSAEDGAIRTDALLKSYLELERKLGTMVPLPLDDGDDEGQKRLRRAFGVPELADAYQIVSHDELLEPDSEINARLHDAGFTERQAQLVYDLAAERLLPLIDATVDELQATRDVERLAAHFGGEAAWQTMARQIKTWGKANLAEDVLGTLSSSYDGVLAIHQMMQAREPAVLREANGPASELDEVGLAQMMRDPRYWRDRDPAFVAQVTEGFRRLYPIQT